MSTNRKFAGVEFWRDENGSVDLASYLLLVTILGLGGIVGLVTVRNHIVQEFGDIGLALENIKQSYSMTVNGKTSVFVDDGPGDSPGGNNDDNPADPSGAEPAGISVQEPATDESAEFADDADEERS